MAPATSRRFRDELTACLALVAPVGMSEEARGEWLAVAWRTLRHLPADLLSIGCARARASCDHPAKIVPAIVAETGAMLARRRDALRARDPEPPLLGGADRCTPEQAKAILEEFGLGSAFGRGREAGSGAGAGAAGEREGGEHGTHR